MVTVDPPTSEHEALLDEVLTRYLRAADAGRAPPPKVLIALYPDLADDLRAFFADRDQLDSLAGPLRVVAGTEVCDTPAAGHTDIEPTRSAAGPAPGAIGDFELREEIG